MKGPGSCRRSGRQLLERVDGYSLVEMLVVAAVVSVLAGIAVPGVAAAVAHARLVGAARYVSTRLLSARHEAAARSTMVALRIVARGNDLHMTTFLDANHNGVRAVEVANGTDPPLEPEVTLSHLFRGVGRGTPDGTVPDVAGDEALFSFSPTGTSSSGTVYVRANDGNQYAVRVLGATGRIRLQRFRPATGDWVDVR